jgi:hypothetical protein
MKITLKAFIDQYACTIFPKILVFHVQQWKLYYQTALSFNWGSMIENKWHGYFINWLCHLWPFTRVWENISWRISACHTNKMFYNNICTTYKKSVKLQCQVSHKKISKKERNMKFLCLLCYLCWFYDIWKTVYRIVIGILPFWHCGGRVGKLYFSFVWRDKVYSAWTESEEFWIWSVQGDNEIMWSVMWKQSLCAGECLCLIDTGSSDEWPTVFIPTGAVTAQSTHGAVGGISQSVIIPRKVLINESAIKQILYLRWMQDMVCWHMWSTSLCI